MKKIDYESLCVDACVFAQLDAEKIQMLHVIAPDIRLRLHEVTEQFYQHLLAIPRVRPYLETQTERLQDAHYEWLSGLFSASFDANYAQEIAVLGDIHGRIQLPAEFMAGAMSIIQGYFIGLLREVYAEQPEILLDAVLAINSALGFSLYVMQSSYQSSSVDNELERFLSITGMSRSLFENLSRVQR